MICFWSNNTFCLRPEDDKELAALGTIYDAFRAGLNPRPGEGTCRGHMRIKVDPYECIKFNPSKD
jgi:hypothetical protein